MCVRKGEGVGEKMRKVSLIEGCEGVLAGGYVKGDVRMY